MIFKKIGNRSLRDEENNALVEKLDELFFIGPLWVRHQPN